MILELVHSVSEFICFFEELKKNTKDAALKSFANAILDQIVTESIFVT
jgi:hypothetical protein